VTAASGNELKKGVNEAQFKRMGKTVSRLTTIWVDGGFDGAPFLIWVMDVCRWTRAGGAVPNKGSCYSRNDGWWSARLLADELSAIRRDYELYRKHRALI